MAKVIASSTQRYDRWAICELLRKAGFDMRWLERNPELGQYGIWETPSSRVVIACGPNPTLPIELAIAGAGIRSVMID